MSTQSDVTYDLSTVENVNSLPWDVLLDILDDETPGFYSSAEIDRVTQTLKSKPITGFLKNSSITATPVSRTVQVLNGVADWFGL